MVIKQCPALELANQMPVRNMDLARAPRRTARKKGSGYENGPQGQAQTRPQGQAQTRTQGITTVCGIYTGYYWVLPSLTPCFRPGSFPATLAARFRNRSEE